MLQIISHGEIKVVSLFWGTSISHHGSTERDPDILIKVNYVVLKQKIAAFNGQTSAIQIIYYCFKVDAE